MVSMNSIHFQRWVNQFKDTDHEIFWFDIKDGALVPNLDWVETFQNWKYKYPKLKGRHLIKKTFPQFNHFFENSPAKAFEKVLLDIKPDIVHSFVLYISCAPILSVMLRYKHIKWIYSSWGSDLFYYKNIPKFKKDILEVLPRVNYLITDCKRDVNLAERLGFKGELLGVFPGGGGYNFNETDKYIKPLSERSIILVKGYQGRSGRCIEVLKALMVIENKIKTYEVVVFGADPEVETFVAQHKIFNYINLKLYSKTQLLPHERILELMGSALLYIGNSNSDGMPNTLLEAIILGAFPIQSNPGGASEDVITDKKNGMLIQDCLDIEEIKTLIINALNQSNVLEQAFNINQKQIKPKYEITLLRSQVLEAYSVIEKTINDIV